MHCYRDGFRLCVGQQGPLVPNVLLIIAVFACAGLPSTNWLTSFVDISSRHRQYLGPHMLEWYWCRGFRQIDEAIDCHGSDSPQPVMQANFRPNSVCSQRESVHQTEFWKDLLSLALGSTSALVSLCLKVATAGCMKFRHQLIILSVHGLCQGCALSRWQTGTVWWC